MLQLRKSDNTVVAATHGRGLFTTAFRQDLVNMTNPEQSPDWSIFPNPATTDCTLELNSEKATGISVSLYDIAGKQVWKTTEQINTGNYSRKISLTNRPSGVYVVKLQIDGKQYSKKLVKK